MRSTWLGALVATASLAVLAVGSAAAPGAGTDGADIAVQYVNANAQGLGLTGSDVKDMRISSKVVDADTGVTHVYLQQTHRGIGVYTGLMTVNVAKNGSIISTGSRFVPNLAATADGEAKKDASQAVDAAAEHVDVATKDAAPAETQLVWHPLDKGGARLAWNVELNETSGEHMWSVNVDAETGAVLATQDFVDHDNVDAIRGSIARNGGEDDDDDDEDEDDEDDDEDGPVTVNDGSSYRVFALPLESPSDGGRSRVRNPATLSASPFGWHDTDGLAGPEFTLTRGNNVHAYADRDNNNITDPGTDPDGGAGLDFDFALDLTTRPLDSATRP